MKKCKYITMRVKKDIGNRIFINVHLINNMNQVPNLIPK